MKTDVLSRIFHHRSEVSCSHGIFVLVLSDLLFADLGFNGLVVKSDSHLRDHDILLFRELENHVDGLFLDAFVLLQIKSRVLIKLDQANTSNRIQNFYRD